MSQHNSQDIRPAFKYYGGKGKIADWIISHFPPHTFYLEPCGGAATVLLRKKPSTVETYNDLNGEVVNFFRVLRDDTDELCEKIILTPWAREEYDMAYQPADNDIERARRFWCRSMMSIDGSSLVLKRGRGMRFVANTVERKNEIINREWVTQNLKRVASRLRAVQLENRPWQNVVERFTNHQSLCYFDPPYVLSERSKKSSYAFEWSDGQHRDAAAIMREAPGYIIVSGYSCELYTQEYEAHGWKRTDKMALNNSGNVRAESLWLSPRTVEALGGWLFFERRVTPGVTYHVSAR